MTAFNPYKVLRVRSSAPAERIKKAFRKRSKETHPDVGGSQDAFMEVRRAYFILADPERRRKYDRDGIIDDLTDLSFHGQVAACQAQLFEALLREDGAYRRDVDLIKSMVKGIQKEIELRDKEFATGHGYVKRLREMQRRIKRADGSNLFSAIVDKKCDMGAGKLSDLGARLRVLRAALAELETYTCVTEMARQVQVVHQYGASASSTTTSGW